jgi:acyl carrier protein
LDDEDEDEDRLIVLLLVMHSLMVMELVMAGLQ